MVKGGGADDRFLSFFLFYSTPLWRRHTHIWLAIRGPDFITLYFSYVVFSLSTTRLRPEPREQRPRSIRQYNALETPIALNGQAVSCSGGFYSRHPRDFKPVTMSVTRDAPQPRWFRYSGSNHAPLTAGGTFRFRNVHHN